MSKIPDQCEKCEHKRFRQSGDDFICKECGHIHRGAPSEPEQPPQNGPQGGQTGQSTPPGAGQQWGGWPNPNSRG